MIQVRLHHNGEWILGTTETGIKINAKIAWYKIAWSYVKYLYYNAIGRI